MTERTDAQLVRLFQEGFSEAGETLLRRHRRFILNRIYKVAVYDQSWYGEDIVQQAYEGFLVALRNVDPHLIEDGSIMLTSYAYPYILEYAFGHAGTRQKNQTQKRPPDGSLTAELERYSMEGTGYDDALDADSMCGYGRVPAPYVMEILAPALNEVLTLTQWRCVVRYWGLLHHEPMTEYEIAAELDIARKNVHANLERAYARIRRWAEREGLTEQLNGRIMPPDPDDPETWE